eukprot:CAMPEP_0204184954 /NCGR_PEP_ID=MMETSP0361-20130328/54873_1 /ASSEMBLY_ACC=CAM_ASM_000343 /TAXON_ID=268821 /ORGANISM="Scrippsiella Hangoei, Strain SHTV-5" /LENGTH=660 /DNA_ID=CAMNT_0051145073 /DNA_START=14 /DNA_END=1996 /DNA_ORIENTATION=+
MACRNQVEVCRILSGTMLGMHRPEILRISDAAGTQPSWLWTLAEERTLRLLIIPFGTVLVTLAMSLMNGSEFAFVSDALNSEKPEPMQQVISRYYLWHLTIFSIFSFKLRALPSSLSYVAYLNLFAFLLCLWSGFKTWDGSYWKSWRQYLHWASSGIVLILLSVETPAVWWREQAVGVAFAALVVIFIAAFLSVAVFHAIPSTGIPWVGPHVELPIEWTVLGAHFGVVWFRWPSLQLEAQAERGDGSSFFPADAALAQQQLQQQQQQLQHGRAYAPGVELSAASAGAVAVPASAKEHTRTSFFCFSGRCPDPIAQDDSAMRFAGDGQGSYRSVMDYQFVGPGAGDFNTDAQPPSAQNVPAKLVGVFGVLVLIAIVVIMVVVPAIASSTVVKLAGAKRSCTLWGDPHVETFDHSFVNFYGEGEFYVVKSSTVAIQARFLATPFTNGMAATHALAVGGPFLQGHTIVVDPMENGQITWDGEPILHGAPQTFEKDGLATLYYNAEGELVDVAQSHLTKHILHMELPSGVKVEVMRWANHINARITIAPLAGGQDGICGNYNGNHEDDTSDLITRRIGQRVAASDLLFSTQVRGASMSSASKQLTKECPEQRRAMAEDLCKQSNQQAAPGGAILQACIFDVCFGGKQYAAQNALSLGGAAVPEG